MTINCIIKKYSVAAPHAISGLPLTSLRIDDFATTIQNRHEFGRVRRLPPVPATQFSVIKAVRLRCPPPSNLLQLFSNNINSITFVALLCFKLFLFYYKNAHSAPCSCTRFLPFSRVRFFGAAKAARANISWFWCLVTKKMSEIQSKKIFWAIINIFLAVSFIIFDLWPFCQTKSRKWYNIVSGYKKGSKIESHKIFWCATPKL